MLGPFPVVRVPSISCNAHRRCRHQSQVLIHLVQGKVILLPGPHRTQGSLQSRILLIVFLLDNITQLPDAQVFALCCKFCFQALRLFGHIDYLLQEEGLLAGNMSFFGGLECPESVFQIIALAAAQAVDIRKCTVVVGNQQTLIGNEAARASEIQRHHGIAKAASRGICIINFTCAEFQPPCPHILFQSLVDGIYHPHTLVSTGRKGASQNEGCNCQKSFHFKSVSPGTYL